MPARPQPRPPATRARLHTIADRLALERGGPEHVSADDLRGRLDDVHGKVGGWHAEWFVLRSAPAPARPAPAAEPPPAPAAAQAPAPGRGRPRKTPERALGSFLDTDAEERAEERRARQARRTGRAPAADTPRRGQSAVPPDLSTAAGRLRAAVEGTARPGAPKRRRCRPVDWKGAFDRDVAHRVATWLCDVGRPARSREIFARFLPKGTYEVSAAAEHHLVVRALEGSGIVFVGREWWFAGEEKPRKAVGDTFEELLLEAAKETLRETGLLMSAPELEAVHAVALPMVRKGYLGEALRREAAKFEAARPAAGGSAAGGRGAARGRAGEKKTAAGAAVSDGGIEKVGEAYRWVAGEAGRG